MQHAPRDATPPEGVSVPPAAVAGEHLEQLATRLQAQVLDHLLKVSYALASVAGSRPATRVDQEARDLVLEAIGALDDVAREIRAVVVDLRRHDD